MKWYSIYLWLQGFSSSILAGYCVNPISMNAGIVCQHVAGKVLTNMLIVNAFVAIFTCIWRGLKQGKSGIMLKIVWLLMGEWQKPMSEPNVMLVTYKCLPFWIAEIIYGSCLLSDFICSISDNCVCVSMLWYADASGELFLFTHRR